MTLSGLPGIGSVAFGLAWASVGIAFAAIAALAAQLTRSARTATGIGAAILAVVYLLRAVGDTVEVTGPQWLSWLSPIGWAQQFRPYAGNRWWVLLIVLAFTAVVTAGTYALVARRDLGAGLLPDRAGPGSGAPGLRNPLALAWRLQRGLLLGWAAGFTLLSLILGNMASNIGDLLDSPQFRDVLAELGGDQAVSDAFLAAEMSFIGIAASAYGIQAAMRLRTEESGLLAEQLLATATGRICWATSHVTVAILGSTALLTVAGAAAGLAHSAQTGDAEQFGRVLGAALVYAPATWVLTGIVVAAFGLAPRLIFAGWVALVGFLLLAEVGPLLKLDQWVMDLSPFGHVPRMPGAAFSLTPMAALLSVAVVLTVGGLVGFRRRDLVFTA
jgi:ABC-2 type transport system permease protein